MKKRRIIVTLLCLALCAAAAFGAVKLIRLLTATEGAFNYALLDDGTAKITRYRGWSASVEIPAELDGHPVTRIGEKAFFWRIRLASLSIPDGIKVIEEGAFAGCSALTGVALPGSVVEIGDKAFADCARLASVSIPDGVTAIGDGAFDRCASLTEIALPDSVAKIGGNPFSNCKRLERVVAGPEQQAAELTDGVLRGKDDARLIWYPQTLDAASYEVPAGIAVIGDSAFTGCKALTGITLPEGVTAIGDHAFDSCRGLTGIDLPADVASIGNVAFSECTGLTRVSLPEGLAEIGFLAFYGCEHLAEIDIPDSVAAIGNGAFIGCKDLTVTVGRGTFAEAYCKSNDLRYAYRGEQPAA